MLNPQPGDFVCVAIPGALGTLVKIGEWLYGFGYTPYEHVEIYVGQPDEQGIFGYTISTYPDGNGKRPLLCPVADLPSALWSTGKITVTDSQRQRIVNWCNGHADIPYSAADYFALAAHRLHIPVPGLKNFIADTGHMICSQYVDYAYMQAGVHLFNDNRWPGYVVPMDLAHLIEN